MIRHAMQMVGRNARSYLLLSVTVTLSFALLLGYLGFTDSDLYNRYKTLFAADRTLIHVWSETVGDPKFAALESQTAELDGVSHYEEYLLYPEPSNRLWYAEDGTSHALPAATVHALPLHVWDLYVGGERVSVDWFDEKAHTGVSLHPGEAILESHYFALLGLDRSDLVWQLTVPSLDRGRTVLRKDFTVVGTYTDPSIGVLTLADLSRGDLNWTMGAFVLQADLGPIDLPDQRWNEAAHYHSDSPEQVYAAAQAINFAERGGGIADPIASQQTRALAVKQTESRTKATVAAALLLLLGINLYSAFSNALSDRKYEIGVKRALGASAFSIVKQFFFEGMLLLSGNILLAVSLTGDLLLCYKWVYEHTPDRWGFYHDWIIYLSPYSIGMFLACAVSLTVGFSLIFSYQSTQVKIVQYLKEE